MPHLYAAVAALGDRLGIPDADPREEALENAIEAASRWIDGQFGGRRFYTTTLDETRYYTADRRAHYMWKWNLERPAGGSQAVVIDDLLSLTTLATDEDGDGVCERVWTVGTDFWLSPRNAVALGIPFRSVNRNPIVGRFYFPYWENAVAVTGKFGVSATTPADIRNLCLDVAELLARPVLDLTVPGVQTYKLGVDLQVTMKAEDLPPLAQKTLERYQDRMFVL